MPTFTKCRNSVRNGHWPTPRRILLVGLRDVRRGFTLIELLLVITIMGVLLALLLPALQGVREAARRVHCHNHLRQIGIASRTHLETYGWFPTGGWGHAWVGVPGRGFGPKQPGGWIYNLLPYLEHDALRDLVLSGSPADRRAASAQRLQTPLAVFGCPTRRATAVWPTVGPPFPSHLRQPRETDLVLQVARSDYAINAGDELLLFFEGPVSLDEGDQPTFGWADMSQANGVSYLRSRVRAKDIVDGDSQTYLVGEKYLNPDHYFDGVAPGDNESMYNGYCADLFRFANSQYPPVRDKSGTTNPIRFGSAHVTGCGFVFCDGSVRNVSYTVDPLVHAQLGNRKDTRP